jgi:hypothetical protein
MHPFSTSKAVASLILGSRVGVDFGCEEFAQSRRFRSKDSARFQTGISGGLEQQYRNIDAL